tara:strand:- start:479 stop:1036 length:558 start_codon:yes stop_codon:yes gene_type:complete
MISVWNPKGGQGKTSISLSIAAAAVKLGLKTVVISQDIQDDESMKAFGNGDYKFEILQGMPSEKPDADLVIIDHPAGDRNPPVSDRVICPIVPCKIDYKTYVNAKHVLEGKTVVEVVSRGDIRVQDNKEFTTLMRKNGASVVSRCSAFERAHNGSGTIFDSKFNKINRVNNARAEIEALLARGLA